MGKLTTQVVLTGAVSAILVGLVVMSTFGTIALLAALIVAAAITAIAIVGAERLGMFLLVGAYATAPMYKGLAPSPGSTVTATDVLAVAAFLLLAPRILSATWPRLPATFTVGIALCIVSGLLATAHCAAPGETMLHLAFWFAVILVLPVALALLKPSVLYVMTLAGAYVAGQLFDTGWAILHDGSHRWTGLSTQPNYFGQAALLSCTLLIALAAAVRTRHRWMVTAAALVCVLGVVLSGSRAATVVLAVVVVCIPFVERVGKVTIAVAGSVVCAALAAVFVLPSSGANSALGRLAGLGGSSQSDLARTQGLHGGLDDFFKHPFLGNGMTTDILYNIHNGPLEVAVSIGLFGLVGYLLVLFSFIRLLLTDLPLRRLGYPALAFLGFGATVPGLYDRSVWLVVALGMVAWQYAGGTPQPLTSVDRVPGRNSREPAATLAADVSAIPEGNR